MADYAFRLNGVERSVASWDPAQPLLYVLRNALALNGPKYGCGLGQCGACMVLVEGEAVRACVTPIADMAGKEITTLEGLGSPEKPDPLQAAFIAEQAVQCGYCTNGLIIAAKALLARNAKPSADQVKEALAGCLCRCGTHGRVLRAVLRVAQKNG